MKKRNKLKSKKKKPEKRFNAGSLSLAVILVSAFLFVGGYLTFVVYPENIKEMNHFAEIPWMTFDQFKTVGLNQDSLIQGNLSDNKVVGKNALVAYVVQRWDVTYDDEEDAYEGRWETISSNWPKLTVTIPRGKVRTGSGVPSRLMGSMHEYVTVRKQGPSAEYNDELLPHGSERIRGVKNRDLVTVVGEKFADDGIKAEYFYYGSRESFLKALKLNAGIMRIFGIVLFVVGLILGKVMFFRKE